MCHFFVLATFWRHLWSITEQTHGSMESNVFVNYKMWPLAQKCTLTVSIGIAKNCSLAFCHRFVICLWLMGCHSKRLGHPVQTAATICLKNSSSVLMVEVICLEKIFISLSSSSYPFQKYGGHPFEQLRLSAKKIVIHLKILMNLEARFKLTDDFIVILTWTIGILLAVLSWVVNRGLSLNQLFWGRLWAGQSISEWVWDACMSHQSD